jgi:hypothetical protein
MKQINSNSLFVFKEQTHFFGIRNSDFDTYFPLNRLWISPTNEKQLLWKFEGRQEKQKGYFIAPGILFGFKDVKLSESSIVFLKKFSHQSSVGLVMNDFYTQIVNTRVGPKVLSTELIKNFPEHLPKSAFHFVKRYKRKNIMVINMEGLLNEYEIEWPK